ncbi:enoyl-CoA hydratase [Lysinibacillus sp. KCTC 33748]|uniref:enoyl-CoA hydratase n=1 Tax=unclassified Lysinibacillus TaxID=2636778 RepID=UPI0009A65EF2|nr:MULTISPECIES: enoyl-CoA hydratase [unclassified Lysinibacillus]OXS68436.1 enoyl-CoA hydratase [Lysinibacillus sp. KCTC 33748]SKC11512.1 Enoyl-CoA hydratase/carnithine racemase [Lysinibacillus sp. AC-3]
MEFSTITLEKLERRATLTLNRPHAMNAMDDVMMRELAECFEALQQEQEIQILVIRGEGKVFSAGGDIKAMLDPDKPLNINEAMVYLTRIVKAYYQLPMIVIAAVHGASAGLGFSLALGADIVVACENSKLAMNFIGIGLIPDGGGHFFMKERVGTVKAKQMIWEGKVLTASEAHDEGLIDYVAPDGTVFAITDQLVGKMLASPIASMITTKKILHAQNLPQLESILSMEAAGQEAMRKTTDHLEGIHAFVEKRAPAFVGK